MVIRLLRRNGVNLNAGDEYNMTGLHLAAIKGNYAVIEYILEKNSMLISMRDKKVKFLKYFVCF